MVLTVQAVAANYFFASTSTNAFTILFFEFKFNFENCGCIEVAPGRGDLILIRSEKYHTVTPILNAMNNKIQNYSFDLKKETMRTSRTCHCHSNFGLT